MLEAPKQNISTAGTNSICKSLKDKEKTEIISLETSGLKKDIFTRESHRIEDLEGNSSQLESFCRILDPTLLKMLGIFSPLVTLISGLTDTTTENQGSTKEELVSNLSNIVKGIQSNIESDKELNAKLSKRANEALSRLYKSISSLESDNKTTSADIRELISQWKENKSHRALLEIAERIRSGECARMDNKDLRRALIEGLESFASSLEEAHGHPESEARDEAIEALEEGADRLVENVEIIEENGGDENLSEKDRHQISTNFETAQEIAEEVANDPKLSPYIEKSRNNLIKWANFISNFIERWNEEEKEIEKKESEKREKELCQLRHKKDKEISEYKRTLAFKLKLINKFNFITNKIKAKIDNLSALLKFGKPKNQFSVKEELSKYKRREERVECKYNSFSQSGSDLNSKYEMAKYELEISHLIDGNIDCHC